MLLGGALFFIGFPLAGVLYSYQRARMNMEAEAAPFAKAATLEILGEGGFEELYFLGTLILKAEISEEGFLADRERWGNLESLGEFKAVGILVGERADEVWQFVTLEADAEFENGRARVRFRAARRSSMQRDWKIEEFAVSPRNVE